MMGLSVASSKAPLRAIDDPRTVVARDRDDPMHRTAIQRASRHVPAYAELPRAQSACRREHALRGSCCAAEWSPSHCQARRGGLCLAVVVLPCSCRIFGGAPDILAAAKWLVGCPPWCSSLAGTVAHRKGVAARRRDEVALRIPRRASTMAIAVTSGAVALRPDHTPEAGRQLTHLFTEDGGAQSISTMPLDTYPHPRRRTSSDSWRAGDRTARV